MNPFASLSRSLLWQTYPLFLTVDYSALSNEPMFLYSTCLSCMIFTHSSCSYPIYLWNLSLCLPFLALPGLRIVSIYAHNYLYFCNTVPISFFRDFRSNSLFSPLEQKYCEIGALLIVPCSSHLAQCARGLRTYQMLIRISMNKYECIPAQHAYLLTYLPQQPDRNLPDEGATRIWA